MNDQQDQQINQFSTYPHEGVGDAMLLDPLPQGLALLRILDALHVVAVHVVRHNVAALVSSVGDAVRVVVVLRRRSNDRALRNQLLKQRDVVRNLCSTDLPDAKPVHHANSNSNSNSKRENTVSRLQPQ